MEVDLQSADSVNAVWGRVLNPTNRSRTAGGSTGGEAALLAMKGSPLGLGTDIGELGAFLVDFFR